MNALLTALLLIVATGIIMLMPADGAPAVLLCAVFATLTGFAVMRSVAGDKDFMVRTFIGALLVRMLLAALVFYLKLHEFFGPDALNYDEQGYILLQIWRGERYLEGTLASLDISSGWGMIYMVAGIYGVVGRTILATQLVNAVMGAATAVVVAQCAQHIFQNTRVTRLTALSVAFYPSLVLWSSLGLKDAATILFLTVIMLATLKLGERLTFNYLVVMVVALFGMLSFRFYIFYMVIAATGGAFMIGMRAITTQSILRQFVIIIVVGLSMTYVGVTRNASTQLEKYGSFEAVQRSRQYSVDAGNSSFGEDVDVSTTTGAITALPIGLIYLLFAPFPWQLGNLRQLITLPEMVIWWVSFPLLVTGLWFALKYRLRQALPILIFITMLTLAYSIYQGNVGTAYRQRAQLLVFYFIFSAVGAVLLKERHDNNRQQALLAKQAVQATLPRKRF
jgi:hypothetical protein